MKAGITAAVCLCHRPDSLRFLDPVAAEVWDQIQYLKGFVPIANFVEGWVTKVEDEASVRARWRCSVESLRLSDM